MKYFLQAVLLGVFFVGTLFAQNEDVCKERVVEDGFSYCLVDGWKAVEFPGMQYKILLDTSKAKFADNFNFIEEKYKGDLKKYVDDTLKSMQTYAKEATIKERKSFQTNSKTKGEYVIVSNVIDGRNATQISFFFLREGGKTLVATYTTLEADSARYMPIALGVAKTLKF